jgi:hypothetical protein
MMGMAKLMSRSLATIGLTLSLLVVSASMASAFNLRAPQVAFNDTTLLAYLNSVGESINPLTDQVSGQIWNASISGNATFTLMIELTANAPNNALGVYNTGVPVPPLFNVFPGSATAGWFATAHFFSPSKLTVTLFDNNSVIQGQITYTGVNANGFGFYLVGPGGTFYSEDSRNPTGKPRMLTFLGTGNNFGDWWNCFEDSNGATATSDFDDAVMLVQSVIPTPTVTSTWGKVKKLYR